MNKTKRWFLQKIKLTNLQPDSSRKKEKNQINKTRTEKGQVTKDNAKTQIIIRYYYEKLWGKKMDSKEEMDRYLEKFNLLRLNQEEREVMNNPITSTDIEAVVKKKSPQNHKPRVASQKTSIKHLEKS